MTEQWQGIFQFNLFMITVHCAWKSYMVYQIRLNVPLEFLCQQYAYIFFSVAQPLPQGWKKTRLYDPYFSVHSQNRYSLCAN